MQNVMVYLVGPPGVGKYTVGKLVAEQLSAKLLDNLIVPRIRGRG